MGLNTVALADYLHPERVVFLVGSPSRRDILLLLAELTSRNMSTRDRTAFVKAIFEREDVASTALAAGVAIPHARLTNLDRCLVTIGIARDGVDWASRDGQPVRLIVMIAARERERSEHLHLMATLAARLGDRGLIDRMVTAADAQQALGQLIG